MCIVLKNREFSMAFKINNNPKINSVSNSGVTNTSNFNTSGSSNVSVFSVNDDVIEKLCAKLQISREQLDLLVAKYPDFYSMDPVKQAEIAKSAVIDTSVSINENDNNGVSKNQTDNHTNDNSAYQKEEQAGFNHNEYSKLSVKEKVNVYAQELAKNKFLYAEDGSKKTLADWDALSQDEQNNLIKKELGNLQKEDPNQRYDAKSISNLFELKMTKLQAANLLEENISTFNKKGKEQIADAVHEYLFGVNSDNLSQQQNNYLENQYVLSKAVIQACKDKGDNTYVDGVDYNLPESEISEKFSKGGILSKSTKIEVQLAYLENKKSKGIALDETEQAVYERLGKLVKSQSGLALVHAAKYKAANPDKQVNYGRLDALKKSEFGKDFEAAVNDEDKNFVIGAYIKKVGENLSPEEKAKLINELTLELMYKPDNAELVADVHSNIVENSDEETVNELMQTKEDGLAELNVINADKIKSKKAVQTLAITHEGMIEDNPERAEMLASDTMDNLSTPKLTIVSGIYSASKSENIQRKLGDKALSLKIENEQDIETQRVILEDVHNNSNLEVRKDIGSRIDETHKDNQLPLTEIFIQDKEVAKAMNENGTLTRYHKDNLEPSFTLFKDRFEQDDFSKEEAISQLNVLADQIKDCHKDSQLAMHKDIMQSKYSEVQEHAAANIKDYDMTVQAKAVDTVYASNNEKAIEAAVTNLENAPSYIQETELPRVTGEAAARNNLIEFAQTSDAVSLQERLASGVQLSQSEFDALPSDVKREYFANYFKKLPLEQKIKLLSSIPNGAQKKTIYVMIARTDVNLFNAIVKDKDRADMLLSMGLPNDVNNKITNVVKFLAVSDVGYQNIAKKHDIEYDNDKKANNSSYTTNPYGFDAKEIYLKDKKGNLMV